MDMTAEFYLSTVDRIFKKCEIAKNDFVVAGRKVDIGKITTVAVKTVEGAKDDITAPGQCIAALDLCTGLPDEKKASHVEPGAGHYGIFAGKSWRNNIRPLVLDFIDANADAPKAKPAKKPANKNSAA
jgi:poly(3-hydroxybutyrate) depolymerase